MRKKLLLGFATLMTFVVHSQVILYGVSPANIQGAYDMEYGKTTSSFGYDMTLPANSIEETLVLYEADTLACSPATNSTALAGKIAVVYRGDCQFGVKAQSAEAAGAIGCIIINNIAGAPIPMDGGTAGPGLNIPVVMISDVDGATLVDEMNNGPVVMFMGNKDGHFANDIGSAQNKLLRPRFSSMPSLLAADGSEYDVKLGGKLFNYGSNDQTNVTLQAIITLDGVELYNETSDGYEILSGDSLDYTLPDYVPTSSWDEGYYSLRYIISSDAAVDEYEYDNEFSTGFVISPSDYSFAEIDETTFEPISTGGIRPTEASYFSLCIHFRDPNASRVAPYSISFSALKSRDAADTTLTGEEMFLQIVEYNDVFTDVEDTPGFEVPVGNYREVLSQVYEFPSDLSDTLVTVGFDSELVTALEDNKRYMFCVTTYNKDVFLGSSPGINYEANYAYYKQPMFPIETAPGVFDPRGFREEAVPGIAVSMIPVAELGLAKEKIAIDMNAYPSPASSLLNIDFKQNEVSKVELVNMMGQTVASQSVTKNTEKTTMNVANVDNGVYIVKVYLTNNMVHTMQVVVNH